MLSVDGELDSDSDSDSDSDRDSVILLCAIQILLISLRRVSYRIA